MAARRVAAAAGRGEDPYVELYEHIGLTACTTADVLTKLLMLPFLSRLPHSVREQRDGGDDD